MTWWAWTLLFVAGRLLGSPAAENPGVERRARLDLSWTASGLPPEMREGVIRGIASGSKERALLLAQAAVDGDLATSRETRAAAVWLHLHGIPSLSAPGTARGLESATRAVLLELARRLPSALVRDFRETLGAIDLPALESGRVSPHARKLLEAFFTGTARGLGAAR